MNAAEFLALLDERLSIDGQTFPTLNDYTYALDELRMREARAEAERQRYLPKRVGKNVIVVRRGPTGTKADLLDVTTFDSTIKPLDRIRK